MNIYWPIYQNIESEVQKLTYSIHMSDDNLKVYSSIISDLILRCAAEIESISKELYKSNGGTKQGHIMYDYDALELLDKNWSISKKKVFIGYHNVFFNDKFIIPFIKDTPVINKNRQTYLWNNSYQNLKHDRGNSLKEGNVKSLFSICAALFILNLYYKEININRSNIYDISGFDLSMGSTLFFVSVYMPLSANRDGTPTKGDNFEEHILLNMPDLKSNKAWIDFQFKMNEEQNAEIRETIYREFEGFDLSTPISQISPSINTEYLRQKIEHVTNDIRTKNIQRNHKEFLQLKNNIQYSICLNKNQI